VQLERSESDEHQESELLSRLEPFQQHFDRCVNRLFDSDIISTDALKADKYKSGNFRGDPIIEAMLNLTAFQEYKMTAQVTVPWDLVNGASRLCQGQAPKLLRSLNYFPSAAGVCTHHSAHLAANTNH